MPNMHLLCKRYVACKHTTIFQVQENYKNVPCCLIELSIHVSRDLEGDNALCVHQHIFVSVKICDIYVTYTAAPCVSIYFVLCRYMKYVEELLRFKRRNDTF